MPAERLISDLSYRQRKNECTPDACPFALGPQLPTVHLDEASAERQTKPCSRSFVFYATGNLVKRVEDALEFQGGDANAGVGNCHPYYGILFSRINTYLAFFRRELGRIGKEIEHYLLNLNFIGSDGKCLQVIRYCNAHGDIMFDHLFPDHCSASEKEYTDVDL